MKLAHSFVVFGLFAVTACTQFPELDGTVEADVAALDYPELLPLEPIVAVANSSSLDPRREEAVLQGRLAALRARASRLRGSVLTGAEKQRLARGLS